MELGWVLFALFALFGYGNANEMDDDVSRKMAAISSLFPSTERRKCLRILCKHYLHDANWFRNRHLSCCEVDDGWWFVVVVLSKLRGTRDLLSAFSSHQLECNNCLIDDYKLEVCRLSYVSSRPCTCYEGTKDFNMVLCTCRGSSKHASRKVEKNGNRSKYERVKDITCYINSFHVHAKRGISKQQIWRKEKPRRMISSHCWIALKVIRLPPPKID